MTDEARLNDLVALTARLDRLEQRERLLRAFIVPAYWNALDRLYERSPGAEYRPHCLACAQSADESFISEVAECAFGGGRLLRLRCSRCGCLFGPRKYLDTPEPLVEADYRLLYAHYAEGDSLAQELRAFEALSPRRDGVYLNWGSGAWSRGVEALRTQGWDVWGYEPHAPVDSPFVARQRDQISARFDGIFSNNVIEHLFDPAAQFRLFHEILKPGAVMCHASPCYEAAFLETRFHVFFPLGRAPQALADRTGFQVEEEIRDPGFRAVLFRANNPET